MIISNDRKKAWDNIEHSFVIKYHRIVGTEEDFLNLIKSIYKINPQLTYLMVKD